MKKKQNMYLRLITFIDHYDREEQVISIFVGDIKQDRKDYPHNAKYFRLTEVK